MTERIESKVTGFRVGGDVALEKTDEWAFQPPTDRGLRLADCPFFLTSALRWD